MTRSIVHDEKLEDDKPQEADESGSIRRPSSEDSAREDAAVEEKSIRAAPELASPVQEDEDEDGSADEAGSAHQRPRTQSRTSSTRSRPLSIVPRPKRRGLFAQLAILPEVDRPYDYSHKVKWTITSFVAAAGAAAPMGSAIFYRKFTQQNANSYSHNPLLYSAWTLFFFLFLLHAHIFLPTPQPPSLRCPRTSRSRGPS